jgi:hypothetical protein
MDILPQCYASVTMNDLGSYILKNKKFAITILVETENVIGSCLRIQSLVLTQYVK